jgi:hypothetical protein
VSTATPATSMWWDVALSVLVIEPPPVSKDSSLSHSDANERP